MEEISNLIKADPVISQGQTVSEVKPKDTKVKKKMKPALRIAVTVLSVLLILVTAIGVLGFFFVYVPGTRLYAQVNQAKGEVAELKSAVNEKDLAKVTASLDKLKKREASIEAGYKAFAWAGILPYARNYYSDGKELLSIAKEGLETGDIVIKAISPYTDFLGLKGSAVDSSQTTEDRIAFLTQSVEGLLPYLDTLEGKINSIENSLNKIDASRYPEEFQGYQVRSALMNAKETVATTHTLIRDGKPILTKTSWLLGKDKPRNYLLVFQNDGELRPSGGFWTAYGSLSVSNGKVTPGGASNIYDLDDKLDSTTPAPRIIKAYHINVPYLNLRDSNLSPDFPTDAKIFLEQYYKAMGSKTKFDAVVAIDTQVLVDLVRVLGKLDTTQGTFTTEPDKRCDGCPQIIYQLEWIAGRPRNYIEPNRKGFMGPLMSALLANAMGSEKNKIGPLAEAAFKDMMEKHVMFYFTDPEIQTAAEKANIAGGMVQTPDNVDYLHLNDANFASAKSNIFITQKIKHEISSTKGKVDHKVTVTYSNPSPASNCNLEKGDLCLNAPKYRDMFRFYVPKGSTLTDNKIVGSEVTPVLYEESGKQVFEGFFGNKYPLYAQSSNKVTVQYTSAIKPSSEYTLYLQKQPGTKPVEYEIWVNGKKVEKFDWSTDKTVKLPL